MAKFRVVYSAKSSQAKTVYFYELHGTALVGPIATFTFSTTPRKVELQLIAAQMKRGQMRRYRQLDLNHRLTAERSLPKEAQNAEFIAELIAGIEALNEHDLVINPL